MVTWLGGGGPSDFGIDALVGQHAVLAFGGEADILRALGVVEQGLLAVDQLEEGIVLGIGDAGLVGNDSAYFAGSGVRSHRQGSGL